MIRFFDRLRPTFIEKVGRNQHDGRIEQSNDTRVKLFNHAKMLILIRMLFHFLIRRKAL
jgi:hypothetical protein